MLGLIISIIFKVVISQVVKGLTVCSAFCHYDVSTGRLYDKWDRGTNIDNTDGSYHVYFHLSSISLEDRVSQNFVATLHLSIRRANNEPKVWVCFKLIKIYIKFRRIYSIFSRIPYIQSFEYQIDVFTLIVILAVE